MQHDAGQSVIGIHSGLPRERRPFSFLISDTEKALIFRSGLEFRACVPLSAFASCRNVFPSVFPALSRGSVFSSQHFSSAADSCFPLLLFLPFVSFREASVLASLFHAPLELRTYGLAFAPPPPLSSAVVFISADLSDALISSFITGTHALLSLCICTFFSQIFRPQSLPGFSSLRASLKDPSESLPTSPCASRPAGLLPDPRSFFQIRFVSSPFCQTPF